MTVVSHFHARLNMLVCNYDNDQSFSFKNTYDSGQCTCQTNTACFTAMAVVSLYRLYTVRSQRQLGVTSYLEDGRSQDFPAVTVCNVNPVTASGLSASRAAEASAMAKLLAQLQMSVSLVIFLFVCWLVLLVCCCCFVVVVVVFCFVAVVVVVLGLFFVFVLL